MENPFVADSLILNSHVPAHVHLPVYSLMNEIEEQDRRARIKSRQNELIKSVQPFNLSGQLHSNPLRRSLSVNNFVTSLDNTKNKTIRASPFPSHLFVQEDPQVKAIGEELRHLRIQVRAEELLKRSSLPFTGKTILNRWDKISSDGRQKRELHSRKFSSDLLQLPQCVIRARSNSFTYGTKKGLTGVSKEVTVALSSREVPKDWVPYHKMTKTAILRQKKIKEALEQNKENKIVKAKDPSLAVIGLQKEVLLKTSINNHLLSQGNIKDKLRQYRKNDQIRWEEYNQELSDMKDRVRRRPLLIVQQEMSSARKTAARQLEGSVSF